jgi:hypothetical protein
MRLKHFGWALGFASFVGAAVYLFVYLYRWEWNRAIVAGIFVLIAEIALIGSLLLSRLQGAAAKIDSSEGEAFEALAASRPTPTPVFRWMRRDEQHLGVFIPVLIGVGALLSATAWLVEWFAGRVVTPAREQDLARSLASLTYPPGRLDDPSTLSMRAIDLLEGPAPWVEP